MKLDQHCSVQTSCAFACYPFCLTIFRKQNRANSCQLLRSIYIGLKTIGCYSSSPPPPPHFYCFPPPPPHQISIVIFHHHHHISIVFLLHPILLTFSSRIGNKRLQATTISSFCSNVSCGEQQSWFSSTVGWLSCSSVPVSFEDSHSTANLCTSPSFTQYTLWDTFPSRKKISEYCCHIRMLYLTWPDQIFLTEQRGESLYKWFYWRLIGRCFNCFKLRISNAMKQVMHH